MNHIVFVYFKDGKIKALDVEQGKINHQKMINEGWKHTSTLNPCIFIEQLFNEIPESELRKSIQSLAKQ